MYFILDSRLPTTYYQVLILKFKLKTSSAKKPMYLWRNPTGIGYPNWHFKLKTVTWIKFLSRFLGAQSLRDNMTR